jgi:hypothetical protein
MVRATALLLGTLVATLITPVTVVAATSEHNSQTFSSLYCPDLQSEAGHTTVGASFLDDGYASADLAFWATPADPNDSPITWVGYSNSTVMSPDGTAVEIDFDVYDSNGGDVDDESDLVLIGEATLTATLAPTGDPENFRFQDKSGNRNYRTTGSRQGLAVSGSLSLPQEIGFDLSGCSASRVAETNFSNNPAASVDHWSSLQLSCGWETDDGYASLWASSDVNGSQVEVWISDSDEVVVGYGPATLTRTAFEATVDLVSGWEETEPVGTASARADLATAARISETSQFGTTRYTLKGVRLAVAGSLTIETERGSQSFDMTDASCQAADERGSQLPGRHQRAKPVENDTPETAIPLTIGDNLIAATAGADEAPEAACTLDDGEGGTFPSPITHTVWWRIEGTGAPITVDTGGSTFDTMIAVYRAEGATVGTELGCVDDVDDSLAARITFETASDASYLIQTGGFGGGTGDVNVSVYE